MPLRQQAMPTLMLPNATAEHWELVQGALGGPRPTTLSELRQRMNRYAGGWLGYQGRNKLSVAGLSELLRWFPDLHATLLPAIVPHIIAKIDALTEFCRKTLEFGTGWKRGMWQGGPMWFNRTTHRYQRFPPPEIKRIRRWLPREWVENCCEQYLKMLRQGERKTVDIPREMCETLLANMFLCTFRTSHPLRNGLPKRTTEELFASREPHDIARLRMLVCFFERSIERDSAPPPVDIEKFLAELEDFGLADSSSIEQMREAVEARPATAQQLVQTYQPKLEKLKAERALRRAEDSGRTQGWDPPGAPLTDLAQVRPAGPLKPDAHELSSHFSLKSSMTVALITCG